MTHPMLPDSLMAYKPKEHPYKFAKPSLISFFVFLLSIFFYISIFYIFNLSLPSLFNNNKFWFCISNTLILIIAADYGVFSSSKHKLGFHDQYYEYHKLKQTQNTNITDTPSPTSLHLDQNPKILLSIPKQEKEIKVVQESQNPDDKFQISIERSSSHQSSEDFPQRKTYRRSKSEKGKRIVLPENKMRVKRSETLRLEEAKKEENEFSRMTDEELNRRVEEFIERFNREIRLQTAARNYTTNP